MSIEGEAPEVTFVGGKAIEQSEGLDSNLEVDEREAAKEAVRKAIQEAGESSAEDAKSGRGKDPYKPPGLKTDSGSDSAEKEQSGTPERGKDGKFLPKDGTPPKPKAEEKPVEDEEVLDLDKASVKQILKAREKVAAIKREAKDEVSKERQEFARQQQEFFAQQQHFQRAQAQLQRQQQALQELRNDPARAIRELGQDPEEFILNLAQEGTPEGQQKRQYRELQNQIKEMQDWKTQQARQVQEQKQAYQEHQMAQARHNAVQSFVSLGLNEEKYPHVSNFYSGQEKALVAFGDLAAEEYRTLSGGREGSYADILDYIEDQLAERANNWYLKKGNKESKAPKVLEQEKPKSKGKTLSPSESGERRTLQPKNLHDLDGDERLEAARQAVSVALANSKTS